MGLTVPKGWSPWPSRQGARQQTGNMPWSRRGQSRSEPQAGGRESYLGKGWACETFKSTCSDPAPRRSRPLFFPKQFQPLGTKHSYVWAHGSLFHSNQHPSSRDSVSCVLIWPEAPCVAKETALDFWSSSLHLLNAEISGMLEIEPGTFCTLGNHPSQLLVFSFSKTFKSHRWPYPYHIEFFLSGHGAPLYLLPIAMQQIIPILVT